MSYDGWKFASLRTKDCIFLHPIRCDVTTKSTQVIGVPLRAISREPTSSWQRTVQSGSFGRVWNETRLKRFVFCKESRWGMFLVMAWWWWCVYVHTLGNYRRWMCRRIHHNVFRRTCSSTVVYGGGLLYVYYHMSEF